LQKDYPAAQGARALARSLPSPHDRGTRAKGAGFAPLPVAQLFPQAAIGGAAGLVGDELPSFDREFELAGNLTPPLFEGRKTRRLVEGLLDLGN
jgi:hypothetical protein